MSVLDSIIEGVREDLAARRLPLAQIHQRMEQTAPALDAHSFLSRDENECDCGGKTFFAK